MATVSKAAVEGVLIATVVVGLRRRQSLGNLKGLKRSISEHGLMHPILLSKDAVLVAGRRRLEACRQLGWTEIPARRVDGLSDEDLRAIELQENTEREALNDYETSKARLAEIRQEAADASHPKNELRGDSPHKSRGRPVQPASRRQVAHRAGQPEKTVRETEKHVEIAERYPFMQRAENGWVKHTVLRAGGALDKLPKAERRTVAALLDHAGAPAQKAVQMIESIAAMPDAARATVYDKARSGVEHDRKSALTMALREAPPPDPAGLVLRKMARDGKEAASACRVPSLAPKIEQVVALLVSLIAEFDAIHTKEHKAWQASLT